MMIIRKSIILALSVIILAFSCCKQNEVKNKAKEIIEKTPEDRDDIAEGVVEVQVGSVIPEETWGTSKKVGISFVRTIGEAESKDQNLAFYYPNDIVVDSVGNIFVLDSENHRIQKFNPEGIYLETIAGRVRDQLNLCIHGLWILTWTGILLLMNDIDFI
jgi:hypothetical protein